MTRPPLCPRFHRAIELIGGRWTGPIVQLLLAGPSRFAELRDAIPSISDRMLSERLHELEQEGVITRAVIPATPIRVEYALTEKGRELQASLEAVGRWAEKWIAVQPTAGGAAPHPSTKRPRTASRRRRAVSAR